MDYKKLLGFSAAFGVVLGYLGLVYARRVEPSWLDLNYLVLELPRLPVEFDGYRVVQISDIHMDTWMTAKRLRRIVKIVNEQQPDLIAITGDFVTENPYEHARELSAVLRELSARDGVAAVLGNHDHWCDPYFVRRVIQESRIIDLNNRVHSIKRNSTVLHLAGVDDYMENEDRLDLVLSNLPEGEAAILLAHEPDFADKSASTGRFDLQLSGHSHGGQIVLPVVGPPYLPDHAEKYPFGMYEIEGMKLYTNRGLGMVHLPFRLNARPEISVFTLRSQQKEWEE
jgi:uncharacterized protein